MQVREQVRVCLRDPQESVWSVTCGWRRRHWPQLVLVLGPYGGSACRPLVELAPEQE